MIAVQISAAALLFPFLLPNLATAIAVIVIAFPFVQLAGLLSSIPQLQILAGWIYVGLWLIGLFCWSRVVRQNRQAALWAVSIASLFALGGVVCWYLHLEAMEESGGLEAASLYGPVLAAIAVVNEPVFRWSQWSEVGLTVITGVVCLLARAISTSPHNQPD
jgi:hypothetical protein